MISQQTYHRNNSPSNHDQHLSAIKLVYSKKNFSDCKNACIARLKDYPAMPPKIRSKFTELLFNSVAAEFRKVCEDIRSCEKEENYGESQKYVLIIHILCRS